MAAAYRPGQEIELKIDDPRKITSLAMSWIEQKEFNNARDAIAALETENEQTDAAIDLICKHGVKIDDAPATPDIIGRTFDWKIIWSLVAALRFNLTKDEKKS